MGDEASRSTFSSTWGTVLATAGVAIGLGNIWRFPYMMGKYGGAVFLLTYLLIMVAFGVPGLMAEWALGRSTRRGPWGAFQRAGMPGGPWWSCLLLLTVIMAAAYYGVVVSWVLRFTVVFSAKALSLEVSADWQSQTGSVVTQFSFLLITILIGCGALYFGVKRGIERVSKFALPVFFVLLMILIVRVLTLDGASRGLAEYLSPRWEEFRGVTVLAAMGQAIFSLGLGGTFMVAYGSYMPETQDIPKTAFLTAGADLGAALMAGVIVVPAALAFDIPLSSGPPLMFEVMPEVFRQIPAGNLFGAAFFFSIFLVAMLSLMAAYEVVVAALEDGLGWPRSRALPCIMLAAGILAVPAVLSVNYIEFSDLIWGTTMQPVGAVIALAALAWCMARARALDEIRRNSGIMIPNGLFYWIKYGIPSGILITLVYGWTNR